ncbi:MAG: sulfotransferase, partial [Myxococcota bacterium]
MVVTMGEGPATTTVQPESPPTPLKTFLSMALRNGPIAGPRRSRWALLAMRHLTLAPLRALEGGLYNQAIKAHRLSAPPIFVVGHWRSGTSFMQTLLSVDPRWTTSTVYRSVFPDIYLLTEAWLKPWLNRGSRALRLPFEIQRSMDLDWDLVAEADVALCALGSAYAYSWGHLYPERFEQWLERLVLNPDPDSQQRWLAHHDFLLRKLSFASGGKRVVSKSPGDMGRSAALLRQYPKACFVYIARDPIAG